MAEPFSPSMHRTRRRRRRARLGTALLGALLVAAPALAAKQTVVFTGTLEYDVSSFYPFPTVTPIDPAAGIAALEAGLPQGSPFEIVVEIDPDVPDSDPDPGNATYAALTIVRGSIGDYPASDLFTCTAPPDPLSPVGCTVENLDLGTHRQLQLGLGLAYGYELPLNVALGRTATEADILPCLQGAIGRYPIPGAYQVGLALQVPLSELPPGIGDSIDLDWTTLTQATSTSYVTLHVEQRDYVGTGTSCDYEEFIGTFLPGGTFGAVSAPPSPVPLTLGLPLLLALGATGWAWTRREH